MRGVAQIIAVSQGYIDTLRVRYPWLRATPATELPFGSPDPDLQRVAAEMKSRAPILPHTGGVRLAFAGAIGPGMLAAVEVLFAAMVEARRAGLQVSAHFFGTSYSPQTQGRATTLALATQYGLQECVHEQPDRLRYFDALQVTLEADANLLFGSTDLAFTPSKILAVLAANRPVVAVAPAGSALVQRLAQFWQPCVVFPSAGPEAESIRSTVGRLHTLARTDPVTNPNATVPAGYSARALALQQLEIFAQAAGPS